METYIVQEGDNIVSIAKLFNVSIIDLIRENNLDNVYYLTPGTEIKIPVGATPIGFTYYIVKKGDSLYQIASQYGITAQQLAEINGLELNEYIYPNQRLIVPKEGVQVYITQNGDTVQTIIDKLGTNLDEIFIYNPNVYILPEQLIAYRKTTSQD